MILDKWLEQYLKDSECPPGLHPFVYELVADIVKINFIELDDES